MRSKVASVSEVCTEHGDWGTCTQLAFCKFLGHSGIKINSQQTGL